MKKIDEKIKYMKEHGFSGLKKDYQIAGLKRNIITRGIEEYVEKFEKIIIKDDRYKISSFQLDKIYFFDKDVAKSLFPYILKLENNLKNILDAFNVKVKNGKGHSTPNFVDYCKAYKDLDESNKLTIAKDYFHIEDVSVFRTGLTISSIFRNVLAHNDDLSSITVNTLKTKQVTKVSDINKYGKVKTWHIKNESEELAINSVIASREYFIDIHSRRKKSSSNEIELRINEEKITDQETLMIDLLLFLSHINKGMEKIKSEINDGLTKCLGWVNSDKLIVTKEQLLSIIGITPYEWKAYQSFSKNAPNKIEKK